MPDIVQLSNVQLTHQSNIKNINIYGISQHASHLLKIVQAPHNNEFSKIQELHSRSHVISP